MTSWIWMICLALILPVSVHAQQTEPPVVRHRNQCRLALQIVERGHPAPHERWAYSFVSACGAEAGRAIAARLRSLRTSTDTAELRLATWPASQLRDNTIFNASLDLAGDRGASDVARAFAVRNLIWLIAPTANLLNFDPWHAAGLGCAGAVMDRGTDDGAPLDSDYRDRVRTLVERLARDRTEPRAVRTAALCAIANGDWRPREL